MRLLDMGRLIRHLGAPKQSNYAELLGELQYEVKRPDLAYTNKGCTERTTVFKLLVNIVHQVFHGIKGI